MTDKQNAPRFDIAAIRVKRKKVKGIKVSGKDRATGLGGLENPVCEASTLSNSPKHTRTEGDTAVGEIGSSKASIPDTSGIPNPAFPLIGSSARPLPSLGLVSSDVPIHY